MDKINDFSNDSDIIGWLNDHNASSEYIDYCLKFRDSSSVAGWIRNWEAGFTDFGGHFGTALFNGDMEKAVGYADMENTANLRTMGYEAFVINSTYKSHEALAKASESEDSVASDLWQALAEQGALSDYISGGIFGFNITMPDWVTDVTDIPQISWDELTPTDKQNVINHFDGEDGMRAELCERDWEDYCDDDAYESKATEVTAEDIVNKLNSNLSSDYYPRETGHINNVEDLGDGNVRFGYSGGVIDDEIQNMFESSGFTISNVTNIMDAGHLDAEGKLGESKTDEEYDPVQDEIEDMFRTSSSPYTQRGIKKAMKDDDYDSLEETKSTEASWDESKMWWDSLSKSEREDQEEYTHNVLPEEAHLPFDEQNEWAKDSIQQAYIEKVVKTQTGMDQSEYNDAMNAVVPWDQDNRSGKDFFDNFDGRFNNPNTSKIDDPSYWGESKAKENMEDEAIAWYDSLSYSDKSELNITDEAKGYSGQELKDSQYSDNRNIDDAWSNISAHFTQNYYKAQGLDDEQNAVAGGDWDGNHSPSWSNTWIGALHDDNLSTKSGNKLNYESKASETRGEYGYGVCGNCQSAVALDSWGDPDESCQVCNKGGDPTSQSLESMHDESALWYDTISKGKRKKAVGKYEDVDTGLDYDFQLEDGRDLINAHYTDSFLAKQLDVDKRNARLNYTDNAYGSMFD